MKSTPDLCDAHAEHVRVVTGLHWRSYGARKAFGGPVLTIKCFEDNSRLKECVGEPGKGRVLVVDGGGSLRHALIGDLLAAKARDNGWAGVLVYGACRDVEVLADIDVGLFALGSVPIKSVRRGEGQVDLTINFGGVTIQAGDYLYADANGVVVADRSLD
ncbi:MAG: putative 4-hydroxy-4-methyl-2-oxoglutarate aldolase [Lysobacteraceae bacterium]|nr:MAG: putative 4-hydroxy-4-methyl-2-oxoglutarate aldolase [Xanthomonadaceae bacterium]